jgi:hypothetical protein
MTPERLQELRQQQRLVNPTELLDEIDRLTRELAEFRKRVGTQYGCGGQHHGKGTTECPKELHHHHDNRCIPGLETENARLREALKAALKLPRPWMDGGLSYKEWDEAFTKIESALQPAKEPNAK